MRTNHVPAKLTICTICHGTQKGERTSFKKKFTARPLINPSCVFSTKKLKMNQVINPCGVHEFLLLFFSLPPLYRCTPNLTTGAICLFRFIEELILCSVSVLLCIAFFCFGDDIFFCVLFKKKTSCLTTTTHCQIGMSQASMHRKKKRCLSSADLVSPPTPLRRIGSVLAPFLCACALGKLTNNTL